MDKHKIDLDEVERLFLHGASLAGRLYDLPVFIIPTWLADWETMQNEYLETLSPEERAEWTEEDGYEYQESDPLFYQDERFYVLAWDERLNAFIAALLPAGLVCIEFAETQTILAQVYEYLNKTYGSKPVEKQLALF